MADNVTLNSMTGGSSVAADEISGAYHQRVKITVGADGVNDGDVSSSNPMPVGIKAVEHGANPTAIAAAAIAPPIANRHGIPFKIGGHPNIIRKEFTILDSDGAQTNAALITVGSGNKIVVTEIEVVTDNANSVDVGFRIGFAAATLSAAALAGITGILLSHPGLPSGVAIGAGNGGGIIGIGADGEDLRITSEDPVDGSIRVLVSYYTIES